MLKEHAAIRNGIEKRLSKIKARMPTHSEPEVAGPSQSESENEPGRDHASSSHVTLARIPEMHGAEQNGKNDSSGPESNPLCQCVLRVAPEHVFFRKTNTNESNQPKRTPASHFQAMQRKRAKRIAAKCGNQTDEQRHFNLSQEPSLPE